ncbi:MAG: Lar family restriction alleviation protein [Oscillospiraceae bacterium]|nr:Lar family restriction alleviation protein [Oscillospiraceae bacterium]
MDEKLIELEDCPCCRGTGLITHEGGWNVQVECSDCGAHTVYVEYESDSEKEEAVLAVARLWNLGKVIKQDPGE